MRACFILTLLLSYSFAQRFPEPRQLSDKAMEVITVKELKADLEWLASDAMKGRDTPSPELDQAAAGLAERFEKAGLKPAFSTGFLQPQFRTDPTRASGTWTTKANKHTIEPGALVGGGAAAVDLTDAPILSLAYPLPAGFAAKTLKGHAVRLRLPEGALDRVALRQVAEAIGKLEGYGVVAILVPTTFSGPLRRVNIPVVGLPDSQDDDLGTLTLKVPLDERPYANNVGAVLEGSDAKLRSEVIAFTAHYDHVGVGDAVSGDRIYNGADDDGTGTVSVVALARAFRGLPTPPRRTLLFLCFFGEEKGMLGSTHYVENPAFPLKQHVAVFNLEMLGRPDDIEKDEAWVTGFGLSDFGSRIASCASGIRFYEHPQRSAMLFGASDNISFARRGVVAHSISAGSLHKDYHKPSDEVKKIDFDNMASVLRGVAHAGWHLADGGAAPRWHATDRSARRYREAWEDLHK